ncbi:putative holo-acyl-carrier-protein synthase [Erysiphe neolycopersici]|uniref:Putative holo-acyl-carrier-protein synthase n=1 Tax=Erysiphe neolycopersici TaxID=212602 RepID=A0A420HVY9_9PEZI|nr:putative holo-acyl-carrier-protein synthase [Erysiphe neolycopersici]
MPKSPLHSVQIGVDICCVKRIERLLNLTALSKVNQKENNPQENSIGDISDSTANKSFTSTSKNNDITCRTTQRQRFLGRLFTPYEDLFYQLTKPHIFRDIFDLPLSLNDYKFIAGRFSAKESIIKAVRHRQLSFHDIIILPRQVELPNLNINMCFMNSIRSEPPRAVVLAPRQNTYATMKFENIEIEFLRSQKEKALNIGIDFEEYTEDMRRWEEGEEVQLNISHDGDYAISVCLASTSSSS